MNAGDSGTPLAKKLGLKPHGRLLTVAAPPGWSPGELPDGATLAELSDYEKPGGTQEVLVAFFTSCGELAAALPGLSERIFPDAAVWIAWPRRAAGHDSDIRDTDVRELALALGLLDVKVAALGEDWSGLRLVWRVERRGRVERRAAPSAGRG
jgi:hypothetical protein